MEAIREHYRPKALNTAKKEMNRYVNGLEDRLDKRVSTYPDGEFVLMTRCKVQDKRTGIISHHVKVIGSGNLKAAVDTYYEDLVQYYPDSSSDEEEDPQDIDAVANAYLDMPGMATPRAAKLRDMLRQLWILEGHSDTKQIYNAVTKGEAGFSWWTTEFPDIPFTNKAVESSENSSRIYRVVAPKLYERLVGTPPSIDGPVEEPFMRCERNHRLTGLQQCSLHKGHRGACNMMYMAPVVRESAPLDDPMEEDREKTDPMVFYSYLKEVGHRRDPFWTFNAGEIKKLGVYLKEGHNQLAAYRKMGRTVHRKYEKWYAEKNGTAVWNDIQRKFPDYLDDHVLDAPEPSQDIEPAPTQRAPVRKYKKKKKKTLQRPESTRQKNARTKKTKSLEIAGFV